ncbi:hypothetical protein [Bacillus sp. AFS017336]|uniref:hypothetical protein n=1 Tax=Bacillus sp. AFS017336 TaxID=2033489 RepID=UPI000BF05D7B|nr:hypothetical protein [Bacillus sp. AFS017336]PEL14454.1 hypothetical protein CN601_00085 [Bacillus sp. AFS017336]
MKYIQRISVFILITILLCACQSKSVDVHMKTKILEIPNTSEYVILRVQSVDKGVASEETTMTIKDNKKIKEFIEKVNKMEVVQPSKDELMEKNKELNNKGNYIFVLSDKESMDNKVYLMNFFKDGRIIFQKPNGKKVSSIGEGQKMMYWSKVKHPELLTELKNLLNIKF